MTILHMALSVNKKRGAGYGSYGRSGLVATAVLGAVPDNGRGKRAIGMEVKAAATWRGEYGTAITTLLADGVLTGGHLWALQHYGQVDYHRHTTEIGPIDPEIIVCPRNSG